LPNTQQLVAGFTQNFDNRVTTPERNLPFLARICSFGSLLEWRPNISSAVAVGALAAIACLNLHHVSEFLYFEF
jgi:hypothetical protein